MSGVTKVGVQTDDEVLRVLLVLHQLSARHAHQLDGAADEADIVDVAPACRGPGPEKRTQALIGPRLGEHAVPHVRRHIVAHDELAAHDAVRLGVAAALDIRPGR